MLKLIIVSIFCLIPLCAFANSESYNGKNSVNENPNKESQKEDKIEINLINKVNKKINMIVGIPDKEAKKINQFSDFKLTSLSYQVQYTIKF